MLIRNNDGEIVGEMNVSITQEGTVIRTHTMYQNGSGNLAVAPSSKSVSGLPGFFFRKSAASTVAAWYAASESTVDEEISTGMASRV